MPDHNPYGEPLPAARPVLHETTIRVTDRGHDPRAHVAATLRIVSLWHECDYTLVADEVEVMRADDPECALCGYQECENQCPMMRWRGQA